MPVGCEGVLFRGQAPFLFAVTHSVHCSGYGLKGEDDYEKERNKKLRNTGFDILNSLDFNEEKEESSHKVSDKTAEELANLINTISINEKAIKKASEESDPLALLEDLKGSDNTEVIEGIHDDNEKTTFPAKRAMYAAVARQDV